MKFSAAITLFNPTSEQIDRIINYSSSFDVVFLFDNTEGSPDYKAIFPENVIYHTENVNKGLPYAFNYMMNESLAFSVDFMCTLDQDSVYLRSDIEAMKKFIENFDSIKKTGVIGPFIDYSNNKYSTRNTYKLKKWVITSGAFVNVKLANTLGINYDENYFIDKFEIDLCQNFLSHRCFIIMFYGAVLHQSLGETNSKGYSEHSSLRHYYIFRNRFYFNKKWFCFFKRNILNILQTMRHVWRIKKRENNPGEKIKMLKVAKQDFRNDKYGKYDH